MLVCAFFSSFSINCCILLHYSVFSQFKLSTRKTLPFKGIIKWMNIWENYYYSAKYRTRCIVLFLFVNLSTVDSKKLPVLYSDTNFENNNVLCKPKSLRQTRNAGDLYLLQTLQIKLRIVTTSTVIEEFI